SAGCPVCSFDRAAACGCCGLSLHDALPIFAALAAAPVAAAVGVEGGEAVAADPAFAVAGGGGDGEGAAGGGAEPEAAGTVVVGVAGEAAEGKRRRRGRSEEHTSELQSRGHLVCRRLLEKNNRRRHRL